MCKETSQGFPTPLSTYLNTSALQVCSHCLGRACRNTDLRQSMITFTYVAPLNCCPALLYTCAGVAVTPPCKRITAVDFWLPYGSGCQHYGLILCETVQICRLIPNFHRHLLPRISGWKNYIHVTILSKFHKTTITTNIV